jgi:hypothetical protein
MKFTDAEELALLMKKSYVRLNVREREFLLSLLQQP